MSNQAVPSGWRTAEIGEFVTSWAVGPRFPGGWYDDNGRIATLRTTDMDDNGKLTLSTMPKANLPPAAFSPHFLQPNDLVISRSGTCGITAVFPGHEISVVPGAFLIRFRLDDTVEPVYIRYLLNSPAGRARVLREAEGGVQKNIRGSSLLRIPITIPPPLQQRNIAGILTTLDNLIEKTESLIAKYQAVKQGMMHDLFTRGVDAHGKLRPPQSEAPELYKQSELGWIPKEWETSKIGSVCKWMSGGTPSKSNPNYWNGTIPWVSPKDMKRFEIDDSEDHISEEAARVGTRVVPPGTVLIVIRGMILAHSFPVCLTTRPVTFNQDIKALTFDGAVIGRFLAYWLVANASQMIALATESTHGTKRFDMDDLQSVPIGLPPAREQTRILNRLDSLGRNQEGEQVRLSKLRLLKSGLMQDLLTGKVKVSVDESEEPTAEP